MTYYKYITNIYNIYITNIHRNQMLIIQICEDLIKLNNSVLVIT